tara:strand:+ start:32 stop:361 length:330 start_codon:yes stop_codon:yes gene_type:complete
LLSTCLIPEDNPNGKKEGLYSLNKNFKTPSNVCANPEIIVPAAEKAEPMTPKMVFRMVWKTARMEPMIAVMPFTMEEMREPRLSRREGMFAVVVCCCGKLCILQRGAFR